jgi:hypothetical protein
LSIEKPELSGGASGVEIKILRRYETSLRTSHVIVTTL